MTIHHSLWLLSLCNFNIIPLTLKTDRVCILIDIVIVDMVFICCSLEKNGFVFVAVYSIMLCKN